jgi:hypothetical protein
MALLHRATLRPTKLELLAAWLPTRQWFVGKPEIEQVARYRFDDPAGQVGIETILVRSGEGPVHQVPLTYRGAPLPGGEEFLITTTEHSVLGQRWVYDGCGDPVYAAALTSTIVTGGSEAEEYYEGNGQREYRTPSMTVSGSGSAETAIPIAIRQVKDGDLTRIVTDTVELTVVRRVDGGASTQPRLTGTWDSEPHLLAYAQIPD